MENISQANDTLTSIDLYLYKGPSWQNVRKYSVPLAHFGAVFTLVLPFLSISGSILLMAVILRFPQLRHIPSNLLLMSLSASDLLIGLLAQPLHGLCALSKERCASIVPIPPIFLLYFGSFLFYSSCLNLTMMTVDRYICIVESLRYQTIVTETRVNMAIIITWSISAVIPLLRFNLSLIIISKILMVIFLASVLLIIIFCYTRIFCISRSHKRQITRQLQAVTQGRAQQEFKSANTMFLVIGAVLVSYIPLMMINILLTAGIFNYVVKIVHPFAATFVVLNSSINPWIIIYRSPKLHRFLKKLFKRHP